MIKPEPCNEGTCEYCHAPATSSVRGTKVCDYDVMQAVREHANYRSA